MTSRDIISATAEIRFERVSKIFHRTTGGVAETTAVQNLTLDIFSGELVAVLGKTGCGKSTLFNMIAGLLAPTEGQIFVQGFDPFQDFNRFRGKIAIVFQNDRLLPWRTASENVELGLQMLGTPRNERREAARHWLSRLGLRGHEDDYPHALSGGMRQRVSIARAFATHAQILLCDEPFSALDAMTAQRLREEFTNLVRENGKTAVFITHSIDEALGVGDRIVVLTRPAKIAYDVGVSSNPTLAQKDRIRERILEILAE